MRPDKITLSLAALGLFITTPATAQFSGGFDRYGSGCPGSNPLLGCVSVNTHQIVSEGNGYASIPFGTLIPGGGARLINSIDFPARTRAANSLAPGKTFQVPVSLYSSISGLPSVQLRTAPVTFTGTMKTLRFTVNPPLVQAKGQDLFLVFDLRNTVGVVLPVTGKGGSRLPTFYTWDTKAWLRSGLDFWWIFNVNCVRNGAPELTAGYGPNINRPFELLLRGGRPNSPTLLATGFQRAAIDLTPHGAAGCTLLVSPLLVIPGKTNATGFSLLRLGVPNTPSLIKVTFLTQFAVNDPANALGLVFTNALAGQIDNGF